MAQYAVPQADPAGTVSAGSWEEVGGGFPPGTDLADQVRDGINGGTPNDSTAIRNTSGSSSTCELLLETLSTPDAGTQTLRIRANGFLGSVDVDLYDGASFVDGTTFSPSSSSATFSYNLSTTPSNYNNLRVKLTTSESSINVSEVEFEVPDAGGGGGGGDVEDPTNPEAFLMFL